MEEEKQKDMKTTDFVHLHLHTEYSLLDGAVRISQSSVSESDSSKRENVSPLAQALKARGMDAVAITDHGNMYGAHAFVTSMRAEGIKPIIGQEFYVADDMYAKNASVLKQRYHLILLAKNLTGYQNLMKLSSLAFVDGFYMKPRIDMKHVAEHSEGLICLSACLAGQIPHLILRGDYEGAKKLAADMRDMFAEGDFYIELQDHDLPEDRVVMNPLCQIAKEIGVKVVATNDVHYIEREDSDLQDTMMCINLQCKKNEINEARFSNDNFYLKSGEEMGELFGWCPEALASTREIADKIDGDYFVVESKVHFIPRYTNPDMGERNTAQYLHDLAWENIYKRYDDVTDSIRQRLDYELGVIDKCGFNDYFLIVWDYVHAAQQMGIPVGPGRGSGVGSIVSYSIGITDVDPLKYNLLFERFLSEERVSMPDFDVDFCFMRRGEMIDYCVNKYGKENVAQIIAYSTMSAKAVVKDVARVYDVPYNEAAAWVKEIPVGKLLLAQAMTEGNEFFREDFKNIYDNNASARAVIDIAMKLEGMPRQTSMHAAGVVICGDPIVEHVALSRNGQDVTTQFDKHVVEDIGLLKMDFLGLKTLTDISEALKLIKEDKGLELDFHKIGYEDAKVYELISSGDCEAVFQLESGGMKKFMSQLKPENLEDVMAGISMYRPGPMQFLDEFLQGKRNPDKVVYQHPKLKEVLENTYGCIVYQEQVMQIAQKIAGYSFGGADIMRRGIAKKDLKKLTNQKNIFLYGGVLDGDKTKKHVVGAVANGMEESIAIELFNQILKFANYAFNKSHAAAYTFLTYQTAYLKCYYPTHYIVAVVNNRITNADETRHYINYLRRSGVNIMRPDINRSQKHFSIEGNDVRYGLMGIKNVGEQAVEYVLKERAENGAYKNVRDLLERCAGQINKRMLENLIMGGALDGFGKNRATLMASYERIMDVVNSDKKNKMTGQMSLFDELIQDVEVKYTEIDEYEKSFILSVEKDVLGMYVSGHPLADYEDSAEFDFDTGMLFIDEQDENGEAVRVVDNDLANRTVRFGCIVSSFEKKITRDQKKFAVGRLEDKQGTVAFSMYPRGFEKYGELCESDKPVKVTGKIDLRDESEPKINVDRMELWLNERVVKTNKMYGVLYVLIKDASEMELVSGILHLHEGNVICQAQVEYPGEAKRLVQFPTKVDVCDELINKLKNAVGESHVKYVL